MHDGYRSKIFALNNGMMIGPWIHVSFHGSFLVLDIVLGFLENISGPSFVVGVVHREILPSVQATSQVSLLGGHIDGERNVLLYPLPDAVLLAQNARVSKLEVEIFAVGTGAPVMLLWLLQESDRAGSLKHGTDSTRLDSPTWNMLQIPQSSANAIISMSL